MKSHFFEQIKTFSSEFSSQAKIWTIQTLTAEEANWCVTTTITWGVPIRYLALPHEGGER